VELKKDHFVENFELLKRNFFSIREMLVSGRVFPIFYENSI